MMTEPSSQPAGFPGVEDLLAVRDEHLVRRFQAGEGRVFRLLYEKYRNQVFRVAGYYMRNQADAEDVTQEVFLKGFNQLSRFRPGANLSLWFHRITVTTAIDSLRQRKRRAWWARPDPARGLPPEARAPGKRPWEGRPDEVSLEVGEIVSRLPEPGRTALVLRDLEGLDYEEVAAILGEPVATVRWRVFEARKKFRGEWLRQGG